MLENLCELCESSTCQINLYHIKLISSHSYVAMHKALECINKNHKFIERPVLTNSHKFVMRIKMSLYGNCDQNLFLPDSVPSLL